MWAHSKIQNIVCVIVLIKEKILLIRMIYTPKKGRKNSTPKAIPKETFSPDGAKTVLVKSNPGSFSKINDNYSSKNIKMTYSGGKHNTSLKLLPLKNGY